MNKAKRKTVIAGNWKMNMTPTETAAFIKELAPKVANAGCEVVLCVPAIDIPAAVAAAKGTVIRIGGENVHFEQKGAFTGEISTAMLKGIPSADSISAKRTKPSTSGQKQRLQPG